MDFSQRSSLELTIKNELNKVCAENESDTPDFILADYLMGCLDNFTKIINRREAWYGRKNADSLATALDHYVNAPAASPAPVEDAAAGAPPDGDWI